MPLLSIFTDYDDICFWGMSLRDGMLHFPENAKDFFGFDDHMAPATDAEWIERLVLPEDRPKVTQELARARGGTRYIQRFQFRIREPDGKSRWIEQRGAIDDNDTNPQVIWLSQDVSDRLRTIDSLQAAQSTLQDILSRAEVGMVTLNAGGHFTYCNPAFCSMLGYEAEELIGQPMCLLINPDNKGRSDQQFRRLLAHEVSSFQVECQLVSKSGSPIWVEKNIWLLPDATGREPEFFAMVASIEKRRQALELLRQERDKLQALFDNADVGLGLSDDAGRTIAMNKAALKTHGLKDWNEALKMLASPEEYFSLQFPDGRPIPPDQWPSMRAARGDYVNNYDIVLTRKKTGQSRYVRYTCVPVFDASGKKMLNVYSMTDLTEMRRLHEALSQSQRLEALGRLAGGIAHDFNNVLAVIAGNLELIADSVADERASSRIAAALDAAETGASINQRLLTIARKRLPARKKVNVVRRIRGMGQLLERTIGSNISLTIDLPEEGAFANVDPGELDAAFLNLVSNGRDAMPDGGALIVSIRKEGSDPHSDQSAGSDESSIVLSVRDTGGGMSPETLRIAAEPFFTTKRPGSGVGLGLTGVYAFANECGGHVEADSKVGQGTEIRIYLPDAGKDDENAVSDQAETALPKGAGQLVLVVEDDAAVRDMTCQKLLRLGYCVEEAGSGDEALARVADGLRPACILSDIETPGQLDGIRLAQKMTRLLPEAPTILCTGYHDEGVPDRRGRFTQTYPILLKPYTLTALANAVHDALAPPATARNPSTASKSENAH